MNIKIDMDKLAKLPQDEQIRTVAKVFRGAEPIDVLRAEELVDWLGDNGDRILEMANSGELDDLD
jgi:hypothetical protein